MTTWVALVALSASWAQLDDAAREARLAPLRSAPVPARVVAISEAYLGTSYANSPLGEGEGLDPDPLLRFDAVDCVTFVEQTLAMARSLHAEPGALVPELNAIRYAGAPSWSARNHLVEAQWLPWNTKHGVLRDVTREVAGTATRRVKKVLSDATWREKQALGLKLAPAQQPKGEFELDLLPAADAVAKLAGAPSGLLLVVVRADRPWLVTRVSHMGFLVQGPKGPALRHASRSFKRVVDEPLERYLKRNLDHGDWTVEGFVVLEVQAGTP